MAASPTGRVNRFALLTLTLVAALSAFRAPAQVRLSLEQLNARKAPQYTPAYAGQAVTVRGIVSAPAFHFPFYTLLAIQQPGRGGVLEFPESDRTPGDYQP